jgi:hypothetical protein
VLGLVLAERLSDRVDMARGEVYVGTVVGIGHSPALSQHEFKLHLEGITSDEEQKRL